MIWIVDKKITSHLVSRGRLMAEVPLRISFEYALDAGEVVEGSLSIKVLYNRRSVHKCFPGIEAGDLDQAVKETADHAIYEHLVLSGHSTTSDAVDSVIVKH